MTASERPWEPGFDALVGMEADRPETPLCGARPDLPRFMGWHPCNIPQHSILDDHVTHQDGVTITWNEATIMVLRRMLKLEDG